MSPDAFDRVHDLGSTDLGPPLFTGMTAYFVSSSLTLLERLETFGSHSHDSSAQGITDVGKIKDGDTVVVSGAAGSVGLVSTEAPLRYNAPWR